jgi:hypothetical protein
MTLRSDKQFFEMNIAICCLMGLALGPQLPSLDIKSVNDNCSLMCSGGGTRQAWPAEDIMARGSFLQSDDLEYIETEDCGSLESR